MWKGTAAILNPKPVPTSASPQYASGRRSASVGSLKMRASSPAICGRSVLPVAPKSSEVP